MTAEVVVMNRGGVALAADSAVTVQVGDSSKVRDSALKLFMLSKQRPVGVMVYENSSLLGVPWETIIKLFRERLGGNGLGVLPEYGEALIDFLDGNNSLFPEEVQDRYYLRALEAEYLEIARKARKELADERVYAIGDRQAERSKDLKFVQRAIEAAERLWDEEDDASYFVSVPARDVAGRNSGGVSGLINRVFGNWVVEEPDRRRLHRIAKHLVAKDRLPGHVLSGVVIAGFGEKEHFPSVQHLKIGGVYGGKLKVRPCSVEKVSEEDPSHVMSFAYTDMVDSFLHGISELAVGHLYDAAVFIREMPMVALDVVPGLAPEDKAKLAESMRGASDRKAAEFARAVLEESIARRSEVETAVEALTIKELAQVASTLVSLSSFQQQMSLRRQTVGGPVDVAVVSKGDGFIWIQRKHYFRPELNNHFFQNYDGGGTLTDDGGSAE